MTDQEVLISTLREARRIIGEYTGPRNANQTLTQLIAVLDRQDVAHAIERNKSGFIFQICASGAAVQASHPATIKLTHYRDFRLDV